MKKSARETAQAGFWRGAFGDEYSGRNVPDATRLKARAAMWSQILAACRKPPRRILEVGSNIGNNLRALRKLSKAELFAVEPNAVARERLVAEGVVPAKNARDGLAASIDFPDGHADLAFTSGVLIHVHPDQLAASCAEIHRVSKRYIACIEYFSDKPEEILYRGHAGRLWKRDFGGFWLDQFPRLRVLDYGFVWKRLTGLDNVTWWLFEKTSARRARG